MNRMLVVGVMLLVVPIVSADTNPYDEIVRMTREMEKQNDGLRAKLEAIRAQSGLSNVVSASASSVANQVGFRVPDKTTGKMTLEVAWPPADSNKPAARAERPTSSASSEMSETLGIPTWLACALSGLIGVFLGVMIPKGRRAPRVITPVP
jgi:hypothetical protein